MLRDLFTTTWLMDLPLLAMGMFATIFVAVLVRACQRARKAEYESLAALPLQDDAHGRKLP